MDMNQYQERALETAIYPGRGSMTGLLYTTLGLAGEAGEVAGKVKKLLRDREDPMAPLTDAEQNAVIDEVSDCLWYIATTLDELECPMSYAARANLDKLTSRKERGVLGGSGDSR